MYFLETIWLKIIETSGSLHRPRSSVKTKTSDPAIFDAFHGAAVMGQCWPCQGFSGFFLADLGVAVVEGNMGFLPFQKPLEMPWFLLVDQFWR